MSNIKYMLRDAKNRRVVFFVIAIMSVIAVFAVFLALERPGVTMTDGDIPSYISYNESGAAVVAVDTEATPKYSGTASSNVKWSIYDDGVIYFEPNDTSKTYYIDSDSSWSQYKSEIKAVKAADGLTRVSRSAFRSFTSLTAVDLSDCTGQSFSIESSAFYGCSALEDFFVADDSRLSSISQYAFYNCTSLVDFPFEKMPNMTSIGYAVFNNCTSLKSVQFSDSSKLTSIGASAFYKCSSLETVDLSGASVLTTINKDAFYGDTALKEVTLGDNSALTTIDNSAFKFCESLEYFDFGKLSKLSTLGTYAFANCSNLKSVDLSNCKNLTVIYSYAFASCSALQTVTFGENSPVTKLNMGVFSQCTSLETVDFENMTNLVTIVDSTSGTSTYDNDLAGKRVYYYLGAFYGCTSLKTADLSNTKLTKAGNHLFYGCTSLTSVKLPNTLTSIGNQTFYNCSAIESVGGDLSNVTSIGDSAFNSCKSMARFPFDTLTNVETIGTQAFQNCTSLVYVDLTAMTKLTAIPNCMFLYCTGLTEVELASCVTSIGYSAFSGCTSLSTFPLTNLVNLESVGYQAFYNCTSLKKVDLSKLTKLTAISNLMFSGCTSLSTVTLGKNSPITTMGYGAFSNCSSLTSFPFTDLTNLTTLVSSTSYTYHGAFANTPLTSADLSKTNITSIPASMFYNCTQLTDINFGDNLSQITSIGSYAFAYNTMEQFPFEQMTALTTIGTQAFADCTNLKSADFSKCPELSGSLSGVFKNCTSLSSVDFADDCKVTSLETAAFYNCKSLTSFPFDKLVNLTKISGGNSSNYVFYNCPLTEIDLTKTKLESINYGFYSNDITKLDMSGLEDLKTLGTCVITSTSVEEIDLSGCTSLSSVKADAFNNSSNIEYFDFSGCSSLKEIQSGFFKNRKKLKTVNLSNSGIEKIADSQFSGCTALTEVNLENCKNLTTIGAKAFCSSVTASTLVPSDSCTKLETVNLKGCENLTTIGANAFIAISALKEIDLSDCVNLTTIGENAFYKCTGLEEITLPETLQTLGDLAFNGCTGINTINYNAKNLTSVGNNAFYGAGRISPLTVNISADVETVAANAFASNIKISELNFIGENSIILGENALSAMGSPLSAMSDGETTYYVDEYGALYSEDKTVLYYIPATYIDENGESVKLTEYTVPKGVTTVKKKAGRLAKNLVTLNFEDIGSITTVEASAFANAVNLSAVTAGGTTATTVQTATELFTSVSKMGDRAFYNTSLTDEDYSGTLISTPVIFEYKLNETTATDSMLSVTFTNKDAIGQLNSDITTKNGKDYRLPNIENLNENVYYYATGEEAKFNIDLSATAAQEDKWARVYFRLSSDDITFPKLALNKSTTVTSSADSKSYELTLRQEGDVYYIEFEVPHGGTLSYEGSLYFGNLLGDSATVQTWTQIVEKYDDPLELSPEEYQQAEWYTAIYDWSLNYTTASNAENSLIYGEDGNISLKNDLGFSINSLNNYKSADSDKLANDSITRLDYTQWLILPDGLYWNEEIAEAIKAGKWYCSDESGVKYIYVVTADGTVTLMYFNKNCGAENISVAWDDEKQTVVVTWQKVNDNLTNENALQYEMGGYNGSFYYNADEIFTVGEDYVIAESHNIDSRIIQKSTYMYAYENETSKHTSGSEWDEDGKATNGVFTKYSTAAVKIGTAGPNLAIKKKTLQGTGTRYDTKGGEQAFYHITVSNSGLANGTVTRVYDNLNSRYVIYPADMDKMFADEYGKELVITISNAYYDNNVYENGKQTVTVMNGNTSEIDTQVKGTTSTSLGQVTLKWATDDEGEDYIEVSCTLDTYKIGEGRDYETLEEFCEKIGLVNLSGTHYSCNWYMNDEHKSIAPGEERLYVVRSTSKTTFECEGSNHAGSYSDGNCWHNYAYCEYINTNGRSSTLSAFVYNYWSTDYTITKGVTCNGASFTAFKPGDVFDYSIVVTHSGNSNTSIDESSNARYGIVPLHDEMTGSQAALAPVDGNEEALYTDSSGDTVKLPDAGLRTYTDTDGTTYYLLDKAGTYTKILFGTVSGAYATAGGTVDGKQIMADRIETSISGSSLNTKMYWYYNEDLVADENGLYSNSSSDNRSVRLSYKAIADEEVTGTLNLNNLSIDNTAWVGERSNYMLYAKIPGKEYISVAFDKDIVVENAGLSNEKLTKSSEITQGDMVTYKLTLKNYSEKYSVTFRNAYDMLPETYGKFAWSEENVISMSTVSSLGKINASADLWRVTNKNPEGVEDGRYYIYWNNKSDDDEDRTVSGITLSPNEELYIYVTVSFPDDTYGGSEWENYEIAATAKGNLVTNSFYLGTQHADVTHSLKGSGQAYLQKGVYGVYRSAKDENKSLENTGDRTVYQNKTQTNAYVTYYVTVYNSGTARLYLTDMFDNLPKGYSYKTLCAVTDNGNYKGIEYAAKNYSGTDYPVANSINTACSKTALSYAYNSKTTTGDINDLLATVKDTKSENDVEYVSAYITYSEVSNTDVNGDYQQKLKFTFSNKVNYNGTEYAKANINYDSDTGLCYLTKGQALVFGYVVSVPESKYTDDIANNEVVMQYFDYNGGGFKLSEGVSASGGYSTYTDSVNNGTCMLLSNDEALSKFYEGDYTSAWLSSNVELVRGEIVPGVNKKVIATIDTLASNAQETSLTGSTVNSTDIVVWQTDLQSKGSGTIDNYSVTDTMQSAFYYTRNVSYRINSPSGYVYSSTNKAGRVTDWETAENGVYKDVLLADITFIDTDTGKEIDKALSNYDKDKIQIAFKTISSGTYSTSNFNSYTAKLGETTTCTSYWYGSNALSAAAVASGETNDSTITFDVTFDTDESGNVSVKFDFGEGTNSWLGLASGGSATMLVRTKLPKLVDSSAKFVNSVEFSPVAEYDATNVISGTVVKDSDGEVTGIDSDASVTVSSVFATGSWKTITDDSDKSNTTTSESDTDYIVLLWDENKDPPYSSFTYTLNVQNLSERNDPIDSLVIIDNLPEVGDSSTYTNGEDPRNSEFLVALSGKTGEDEIKNLCEDYFKVTNILNYGTSSATENELPANPADDGLGYTIEFSTENKMFTDEDWSGEATGKWYTLEQTQQMIANGLDISKIRSFRVIVSGGEGVVKGSVISVSVKAEISGTVNPTEIAWNNFGYNYHVKDNDESVRSKASSLKVGVMTATVPMLKKEIIAGTELQAGVRETTLDLKEVGAEATFIIYRADSGEIAYESDNQILKDIHDSGLSFTIVKLSADDIANGNYVALDECKNYTVEAEEDGTYSYKEGDTTWKWEEGKNYYITEIGLPEHFVFSTMDGSQYNGKKITYSRSGRYKITCLNIYDDYNISLKKYDADTNVVLAGAGFARYGVISSDEDDYTEKVEKMWSSYNEQYVAAVKQIEKNSSEFYTMSVPSSLRLKEASSYDEFCQVTGAVSDISGVADIGSTFSQIYTVKNSDGTETTYFFIDYQTSDESGYIKYNSLTDEKFAFVEVCAPEGYSLSHKMYITERGSTPCGGTRYVEISNSVAQELPMTGGDGKMIYVIILGAALILLSTAAVVIRTKRKGAHPKIS